MLSSSTMYIMMSFVPCLALIFLPTLNALSLTRMPDPSDSLMRHLLFN